MPFDYRALLQQRLAGISAGFEKEYLKYASFDHRGMVEDQMSRSMGQFIVENFRSTISKVPSSDPFYERRELRLYVLTEGELQAVILAIRAEERGQCLSGKP